MDEIINKARVVACANSTPFPVTVVPGVALHIQRIGRITRHMPSAPAVIYDYGDTSIGRAVRLLTTCMRPGHIVDFAAPIGHGRLHAVVEACQGKGRVAFISDRVEMREQFAQLAQSAGLVVEVMTGRSAWNGMEDLDGLSVAVMCETMRHRNPHHLITRQIAVIRL